MAEEIKTFKEAIKFSEENIYDDNTWGLWTDVIKDLQKNYEPKIGLTKLGKKRLLYYLRTSNLQSFMEYVYNNMQLYNGVSFEKLAQAWLHPESIEIVG